MLPHVRRVRTVSGRVLPDNPLWFYAGVDLLILMGVARDLLVLKRVHPIYAFGLPAALAAQLGALTLFRAAPPAWMAIAGLFARCGG